MIKRTLQILFGGLAAFMLLGAPTISFDALVPAVIDLPQHIRTVALIDRSLKAKSAANVAESLVTGEILGRDKVASAYALDGLVSLLQNSPRLTVVRTGKQIQTSNTGKGMPEMMAWDEVASICAASQADALISLEVFDSDYLPVTNEAVVTAGFRIYDPQSRKIEDQYIFTHRIAFGGQVQSVAGALNRVLEKDQAVRDVSYQSGAIYARRIAPSWYRVDRLYYRKPKRDADFAAGARMMEVNDWDGAKTSLEQAVQNARKRKIRGRAAHNLAVVYEITGDLQKAREWAQAAWAKYENKRSKEYLYILNERIQEIERLKYQE